MWQAVPLRERRGKPDTMLMLTQAHQRARKERVNCAVAACSSLKCIANFGGNWKASLRIFRKARRPLSNRTLHEG